MIDINLFLIDNNLKPFYFFIVVLHVVSNLVASAVIVLFVCFLFIFFICPPVDKRHKSTVQYASRPDLPKLAYRRLKGKSPGVVFLPGYGSNMNGQKAEALEEFCKSLGHSYLR